MNELIPIGTAVGSPFTLKRANTRLIAVALTAFTAVIAGNDARAGAVVNIAGVGSVTGGSWPKGTPAVPPPTFPDSDSGLAARFTVLPGLYPLLDPATTYGAAISPGWGIVFVNKPAGGDAVLMGLDYSLIADVTPQLYAPSATLQFSGTVLSPTSVEFTGNWSGDAGTLQTLSFFDASNPDSPVQVGSEMFFYGSGSGGGTHSLDFVVSGADVNYLEVHAESIAMSVPEPASTALLAIGALGFLGRRRYRCRARL